MATIFENGVIYTPQEIVQDGMVIVAESGRISYVGSRQEASPTQNLRIDLQGRILAPGLIDIHVHGGYGVSFGNVDLAGNLLKYAQWVRTKGVTGFLLSIAAPDADRLEQMTGGYAQILSGFTESAEALGLHLEGPFLNQEKKGAFNPAWLRQPDVEETKRLLQAGQGWVKQMTLAPENQGALEVAALLRNAGVVAALGHSNTSYELAVEALQGDFTHVTHTFNAQSGFDHRVPGVLGAILTSDTVTAELIADTVHVHPGAMKVLIRCLGVERIVAITDAMAGAGFPDDSYDLAGHEAIVKDGRATLTNGTLAGGIATLDQCVKNLHHQAGVPLYQAVQMASLNPARVIGEDGRIGSIAAGKNANLIIMDEDVNIYLTMVKGRIVYQQ